MSWLLSYVLYTESYLKNESLVTFYTSTTVSSLEELLHFDNDSLLTLAFGPSLFLNSASVYKPFILLLRSKDFSISLWISSSLSKIAISASQSSSFSSSAVSSSFSTSATWLFNISPSNPLSKNASSSKLLTKILNPSSSNPSSIMPIPQSY